MSETTYTHPRRITYLLLALLVAMGAFSLLRLLLVISFALGAGDSWTGFGGLLPRALLVGLRFDIAVCAYLLLLPALLLFVAWLARISSRLYHRLLHAVTVALCVIAFLLCVVDIPFTLFFTTRLNAVALQEVESFSIILGMVFGEPRYVLFFLLYLAAMVGYVLLMRTLFRRTLAAPKVVGRTHGVGFEATAWLLLFFALFVAMRGGFGRHPLRVGDAVFCADPFLNQAGLNPLFTFAKSLEGLSADDEALCLIDDDTAEQAFRDESSTPVDSLLLAVHPRLPEGTNVVLVIMESMSAEKLGPLTPHLNALMERSLCFTQAYSAGIHTYNGIYSTLYSAPGFPARHTLRRTFIPRMTGLPTLFHDMGYSTAFFLSHDEDYDNMRPFLLGNGFDSVVGLHSYPPDEVLGPWGIPDHRLFDHLLAHCSDLAGQGRPFFAAVMTISDHMPYLLPDDIDFRPRSQEKTQASVEYADWALGRFLDSASRLPWFNNTLFVFVADHGVAWGDNPYDMALSYHHMPMIFSHPALQPAALDRLASQLDVGPTVLGLLSVEWRDGYGLDLLSQRRPYVYYSSDDKVGVLDGEYYYIYRIAEQRGTLQRLDDASRANLIDQEPSRADAMRRRALGLIQHAARHIQ